MIAPIQAAIDAGVPVLCVDTTIDARFSWAMWLRTMSRVDGWRRGVWRSRSAGGQGLRRQRQAGHFDDRPTGGGFPGGMEIEFPGYRVPGPGVLRRRREYCGSSHVRRLQSDPDLAGIFGTNLFAAQGAAAAVRQQGLQGKVKMVGFDAGPTQVQDLRSEVWTC